MKNINEVLEDLKFSNVSKDQKNQLELLKGSLEDYFEQQAEKLLEIRYDEERKNIRQHIIERVRDSLNEPDQRAQLNDYDFPYPGTDYYAEIGEYTQFEYFYNLTLNAADTIAAFTTTYAHSSGDAATFADGSAPQEDNEGTRWEKIDVLFE